MCCFIYTVDSQLCIHLANFGVRWREEHRAFATQTSIFLRSKTRTDSNNYLIILLSAHLYIYTKFSIAKLAQFYLQWRRRYRGYRYWGTVFCTLCMYQLVL